MAKAVIFALALCFGLAVASYSGRYTGGGSQYYPGSGNVIGNAYWASWGYWSTCTAHCGTGYQTRTRTCVKPALYSLHGAGNCHGDSSETRECNTHYCAVNGGWTAWGPYGACSASCGQGSQTRYRYCTNPTPAYGGSQCQGPSSSTQYCTGTSLYCPVDGAWGHWANWSSCSGKCGSGTRTRSRYCNYPAPSNGGKYCVGDSSQSEYCKHHNKCHQPHY